MKEFLLDANRASFAPRYLMFEMFVNGHPKFGRFTVTHMADPFYRTTHLTLEDFGSLARYKSGSDSETIERIPTEQIQILNIVDVNSLNDPSPLTLLIDTAEKIYSINTILGRDRICRDAKRLLDELSDIAEEYGAEHPTSNYKTLIANIERTHLELEKFGAQYEGNEGKNSESMRDIMKRMKEEVKEWIIDLLFRSAQN